MFDPTFDKIILTMVVILVLIFFRLTLGAILKRKLHELIGHQLLANFITAIFSVVVVIYLLNVWGITQLLVEWLATLGVMAAILILTVKDIWIDNLFAGISLIGDKSIDIGTDVEIDGKRGKIVEMTLILTKVKTAGGDLIMVPNKKFREEMVIIRPGKRWR